MSQTPRYDACAKLEIDAARAHERTLHWLLVTEIELVRAKADLADAAQTNQQLADHVRALETRLREAKES